ncbi:UNVERIFIED_CONTAM: Iridoid oxidase [Sesamum calycinum]|uniref:Iridoid oxidase n=1 Tax=Sesamum calycinum TaxID=2727403 RepID=A0AAW2JCI8_9LAMI
MELALKANVADFVPFLRPFDPQGIKRRITVLFDRLHKILDDIIGQRVRRRTSGQSDRFGDFLDVLLDLSEEHGPEELNYQNIKILFQDLFIAGTMTTSTIVEWAMAELLHNPPILTKVKQELSNKIPPRELIQDQDIPHLPYLEAVIKETMRLLLNAAPLAPLHRARSRNPWLHHPKHTQVFVNIWSILRDPAYWDDATTFKPDRFLNSGIDVRALIASISHLELDGVSALDPT